MHRVRIASQVQAVMTKDDINPHLTDGQEQDLHDHAHRALVAHGIDAQEERKGAMRLGTFPDVSLIKRPPEKGKRAMVAAEVRA